MLKRSAFTMIELIFVIVIMGIIGKFGVEFLAQAYKSFIFAKINHELQSTSEQTVEFIAARLQNRIKASVIARTGASTTFYPVQQDSGVNTYKVLEWIASDIDGFRGTTKPLWSGIIDLKNSSASTTVLVSPETNTTDSNALIDILSNSQSTLNDSALYFIGSNNDIYSGYGWDGNLTEVNAQRGVMHPINSIIGHENEFAPAVGNFSGVDVYEYYKLSWTANAVVMEDYNTSGKEMGNLYFYHNYQPWKGEKYYDNNDSNHKSLIMKNVSTFQFISIGTMMKIQVCTKSTLVEEYSLCKEKTVL